MDVGMSNLETRNVNFGKILVGLDLTDVLSRRW
jgi:hypothetical protein